jgi:hypothetical protein
MLRQSAAKQSFPARRVACKKMDGLQGLVAEGELLSVFLITFIPSRFAVVGQVIKIFGRFPQT